jgi:3-hydroxyisobutyrate dehydrogenase-like beta-hydroxyacid dehydrogenase
VSADGTSVVAVIGLGRMGGPMADNLIASGHQVRVFDVVPDAVAARVALGAVAAATPADVADGADVVCVVVFDGAQARDVLAGPNGVLATACRGAVIAVHTTMSIDGIHELGELAEAAGVHLIDAGVTGGEPGARAGTLMTMVGGSPEAVEAARPALLSFSREIVHAGPRGAGMSLKLARNAIGYVMMRAVHEAMLLADASGVDQEALRHVVADTDLATQYLAPFAFGGPLPVPADAPAQQRGFLEHTCRLGEKDLDQALALAAALDLDLTATSATRAGFHEVMRLVASPPH